MIQLKTENSKNEVKNSEWIDPLAQLVQTTKGFKIAASFFYHKSTETYLCLPEFIYKLRIYNVGSKISSELSTLSQICKRNVCTAAMT